MFILQNSNFYFVYRVEYHNQWLWGHFVLSMSSFLEWKEEKYKIIYVARTQTLQIEGVSDERQWILCDKTLIYVITFDRLYLFFKIITGIYYVSVSCPVSLSELDRR